MAAILALASPANAATETVVRFPDPGSFAKVGGCAVYVGSCDNGNCKVYVGSCDEGSCSVYVGSCDGGRCFAYVGSCTRLSLLSGVQQGADPVEPSDEGSGVEG